MGHEPPEDGTQWPPTADDAGPSFCDRCNNNVSDAFHRQWSDNDGVLDGCRECLPRSIRFGEDPYDRDKDVAQENFDLEIHNKGKPTGGVQHGGDDDAPDQSPTPF